jgi:hypothetical protein
LCGKKWSDPIALGIGINTDGDEFYPSLSSNQNLYFTATCDNGIGREDIFVAKFINGQYQIPAVLDSNINSQYYEFNAYIHPDENLIVFSSYGRSDELGGGDLYFSKKNADGSWSPSQNLGEEINSSQLDYCPFIDTNNKVLYFTSERQGLEEELITVDGLKMASNMPQNGYGDIYRIPISKTIIH